ncbi:5'/3'-nucleotidase SurE [Candidatus Sumerlaeota bacterium]|nr:5'/3'-nucleotidase SurE [Candidatus Sumerlaeota bacterium]
MTKRILITNDDGIDAPGLQALHAAIKDDWDVLVVAPLSERSGAGCSLSLSNEMKVEERRIGGRLFGRAVDGTPADCVKFALTAMNGYRPDFILSGINRGMNAGNSVFYSGTVAGAIEGTLFGIPAMACSLACWHYPEAFYDDAAQVVARILPWLVAQAPEPRTLWNMNIPNRRINEIRHIRLTTHGTSFFVDDFELKREDDEARYYRNVGSRLVACDKHPDSDDRSIQLGEVSLSLLKTNLTVDLPEAAANSLEATWNALLKGGRKGNGATA